MFKLPKLILIIAIVVFVLFLARSFMSCKNISCINIAGITSYKIDTIDQDDNEGYKAIYKNSDNILRVEIVKNIDEQQAEQIIRARVTRLKGLFSDAPAPYPGMVSDKIVCDRKFVPKFYQKDVNGNNISYFTGFLSSRMTFGTCTEDESIYKGLYVLFHCPAQQKMYQLEFIGPKNEFNEDQNIESVSSLRCR